MPKRILLADDSITIQKVVELTFSDGDYEVTAVNNGARAIQKLGEMRPDIILSDIIMPEKNGYEVCEYVKSHPEYRNIPVVLLTGTFEPFDPDRAEKAGCDAVVTKPFESQSLIHKVEELIAQAKVGAATPPPPPAAPEPIEEAPSPWMDDAPVEAEARPSPFTTSNGSFPAPPTAYEHDDDIFGAAPPAAAAPPMQFDPPPPPPFAAPPPPASELPSETRAFPPMNFDDFQQAGSEPAPPEPSPWDEPNFGGETRAFGKMTFDDLQAMAPQAAPEPEPATLVAPLPTPPPVPEAFAVPQSEPLPESAFDAPFGAPPEAEAFSGETRAFQRMSFDELQQPAAPQTAAPAPEFESPTPATPSPWDEPASSPFGDPEEAPLPSAATQAVPKLSFDDQQVATPAAQESHQPEAEPYQAPPEPHIEAPMEQAAQAEASPWDEQPAYDGATRAFPKMSYEELAQPAPSEPAPWEQQPAPPEPAPWEQPAPPEPAPWEQPASSDANLFLASPHPDPVDEQPFLSSEPAAEKAPAETPAEEPIWAAPVVAAAAAEDEEPVVPPPALAPDTPVSPVRGSDLSDEQVDRIARRVVELMSDQVIRNIAWEVIPDLAEMVVKERIRQLESEA